MPGQSFCFSSAAAWLSFFDLDYWGVLLARSSIVVFLHFTELFKFLEEVRAQIQFANHVVAVWLVFDGDLLTLDNTGAGAVGVSRMLRW